MKDRNQEGRMELIGDGSKFFPEICRMIADSKIFDDLKWHDHEALAKHMKAYQASARTVIFREGDKGTFLCLVIKGKVAVIKEGIGREKKKVYTVTPGKIVGEMAIIDGQPRSASCVAQDDVILATLTKSNFLQLVEADPQLGVKILSKLANMLSMRLRRTSGMLVDYMDA